MNGHWPNLDTHTLIFECIWTKSAFLLNSLQIKNAFVSNSVYKHLSFYNLQLDAAQLSDHHLACSTLANYNVDYMI